MRISLIQFYMLLYCFLNFLKYEQTIKETLEDDTPKNDSSDSEDSSNNWIDQDNSSHRNPEIENENTTYSKGSLQKIKTVKLTNLSQITRDPPTLTNLENLNYPPNK